MSSYRRLKRCGVSSQLQMPSKSDFDHCVKEEQSGLYREIGSQAVWSLSSCKPGFGVEQLRDNCVDTYWQSDGPQPHLVNIQFRRKTTIANIGLFADYKMDESYTPNRISIRAGNHFHDIHEVELLELNEPTGWINVPLTDSNSKPIRAFLIQIAVLNNHQNGRDTHIRQIKIHSPVRNSIMCAFNFPTFFESQEFSKHSSIR